MYKIALLLLIYVTAALQGLDKLSPEDRQSVLCTKQIAEQYFSKEFPVAITVSQHKSNSKTKRKLNVTSTDQDIVISDIIVKEFSSDINWSILVKYPPSDDAEPTIIADTKNSKPKQIIIIVHRLGRNMQLILKETFLTLEMYFNGRYMTYEAKFIIVIPKMYELSRNLFLNQMGTWIASVKMYNTVIISTNNDNRRSTSQPRLVSEIYTWFPFQNVSQCGNFQEFVIIDRWLEDGNGTFENNTSLFPHKLKDFKGCPFVYVDFFNEGSTKNMEHAILKIVFNALSLVPIEEKPRTNADAFLVGTASNQFNSLLTYGANPLVVQNSVTFPHLFSEIRWYVPCPKRILRHGNFYKVFDSYLWLLLFFTSVVFSVVITFVHKSVTNDVACYKSISCSGYCILAILSSVSVPDMPKTTKLRSYLFLWVVFSLIINTVFQCFFTSFLIEPGPEKQISSMEELFSKKLSLIGDPQILFALFANNTFESMEGVLTMFNMSAKSIEYFYETNNSAMVGSDLEMRIKLQSYYMRGLKPCSFLHRAFVAYRVDFFPFSHYFEAFNSKVLQCFEAGLFIQAISNYTSDNIRSFAIKEQLDVKLKLENLQDEDYFIYNIKHLSLMFYILICGNLCSFILFTGELLYFRIIKRTVKSF
ncbi:hypothetical protein L9F63_016791 [Diploptera punctata]|uniref:Uncharacterized protein n=1 Tax=Diploptera punctata TaxID=6984 RepID=A0AAD8A0X4_DIPPU|nr:hypothetical protein L9F63_016791 [Diploptera punctata]